MDGPGFQLRPARREDSAPIRTLIWRVRINPTSLDWRRFWVAVDSQERLLGCGQLKPHGDGSLELASIAVHPQYRGRGIAHAIVNQLLNRASRPLYLRCTAPLQDFYERFGFRVISPDEMPPNYRRDWQMFAWLKKYIFPSIPGLRVMRLDDFSKQP